jgi:hypothetical protein
MDNVQTCDSSNNNNSYNKQNINVNNNFNEYSVKWLVWAKLP